MDGPGYKHYTRTFLRKCGYNNTEGGNPKRYGAGWQGWGSLILFKNIIYCGLPYEMDIFVGIAGRTGELSNKLIVFNLHKRDA